MSKGIHYQPPRIVQGGDRRAVLLLLVLILLVGGWSVYVFDYGRYWAGLDFGRSLRMHNHLEDKVERMGRELRALRLEAAKHQRAAQIEATAASRVQDELTKLNAENAELRREVELLRNLVAQGKGPLFIRDFALAGNAGGAKVDYRFAVVQVRRNIGSTRGVVRIEVKGRAQQQDRSYDLAALTGGKQQEIELDFKHFQEVAGSIELPDGFEPQTVVVEIQPKSRKLKKVKQVYDWSL